MPCTWAARACALLAGLLSPVVASAALTVTPVTWNVIGLDSNSPATGPRYFPVGERVCTTTATGPITVTLGWDSANANINLRAGTLNPIVLPAMAPGACADAYFEVDVNPVAASFDTRRRFHVTATEGANSATSPTPRELYVEHLISQSRNGITAVKLDGVSIPAGGTMALVVGGTYTIELDSFTATQGYNQFESFINFTNTVFQILAVQSTYSANNSPYVSSPSDKFYADSCGWDPNPSSLNYNACIGGDYKTGGTVTTIYMVKIIGGGGSSQTLNTLLYDFSGSSFHYNADFGVGARIATIVDPASLNFAKAFSPSTVPPGGTGNLVFTIGNPNAGALGGLSFNDALPSSSGVPMTIAGAPTSSGCGAPSFTAVVGTSNFSFGNGSVAANASCVITLPVKIAASPTSGTYHNVSGNLFANGTDTGKSAVADLTIGSSTTGSGVCGLTMASWTFAGYTANPPSPAVQAANVATAAISTGASITAAPDTSASGGNPQPGMLTYGWPKNGPINTAGTAYVQVLLDTSKYTAVKFRFDGQRKNNGPDTDTVYYSIDGTTWTKLADYSPTTAWTTFGAPYDLTGLTSTTGNTYFRFYGFGANATSQGNDLTLDNIVFTGCSTPTAPTLAKSFTPSTIPVNGTSVLTFTLTNANSAALTGATFTDTLPAGLQVAASPSASTTCGGTPTWAPAAGATSLSFGAPTGGTIPASGSCTASVTVTATTAGPHTNVSGFLSTIESGTNATSTGSAVATLTAASPPSIQKSFGAASIAVNGQTTLTFTITNPNAGVALAGVAFSDTYPANMTNAGVATSNTCGGTLTANAGANSVALSGGGIAAGGNCSIAVPVTVSAAGNYVNTSGNVSATTAGTGNSASASLAVTAPSPAISLLKQVATSPAGPWLKFIAADPATTQLYFRFVAENVGDVALNPFSVSDPQLAGTSGDPATCAWQTDNLPSTLPALPVATSTVSPVATCVKGPLPLTAGPHTNTATASGAFSGNAYASDPSSTDWFGVVPGFSLTKQVSVSPSGPWTSNIVVAAGTNVYYRFALVNTGNVALTSIGVTDPQVSTASCTFTDPLPIGGATSCVVGPMVAAGMPGSSTINTATGQGTSGGVVQNTAPSTATYTITSLVANLAITKTNGVSNLVAGTPVTYTIVASNAGPDAAVAAQVVDTLPASLQAASWTCAGAGGGSCTASGTGDINDVVNLPAGASVTYTLSATVSGSATSPLANTATVTPPAGANDPDPSNNTATDSDPVSLPTADLAIAKTNGVASVTAGGSVTYTITASNAGPFAASGATVADTLPASLTATWTCVGAGGGTCTASGSGNINDTVSLPAGGSVTYTVAATVSASASGTLTNTATVTPPASVTDPNPANNSATDSDPIAQSADLAITKTNGVASVGAGTTVTYTIVAGNAGPSNAAGATVADTLPATLLTPTWTCIGAGGGTCTASGSGNIGDTVNLPAGASVTYTVTATLSGSASGTLTNTATVAAPAGVTDPNPANNSATDSDPITLSADVSMVKTLVTAGPFFSGQPVTFTLLVGNAGPSTATGVQVADTPANLTITNVSGAGCVALPCTIPSLASGASVTITVTATINAAGAFNNVASATANESDPNPANNTSNAGGSATASADLAITKTNGVTSVTPGSGVTYTITASNAGPSGVAGATVADTVPASLLGTSWTCVGAGGGICTAFGSGSINDTVTLPVGGSVTYTLSATLSAAATGTLTNTATVSPPAGVVDPNLANNTATDSDPIAVAVSLGASKTDGSLTYTPGGNATYTIVVTNGGPSDATNVTVTDALPAGVTLSAPATCAPAGAATCGTVTGAIGATSAGTTGATIPAGVANLLTFMVPVAFAPSMTASPLVNTANVLDVPTGATASASDSDTRSPNVTIAVAKTDGSATYTPGGTATYQITVTNGGVTDALDVNVADTLPAGVTLTGTVTCAATGIATCGTVNGVAGGTSLGTVNATIPAGGISSIVLSAPVAFAAGLVTDPLVNTAFATDAASGATGNGSDSDTRSASVTLALTKTDGIAFYTPGGTATYTITVANTGATLAGNVNVADALPAGVTLAASAGCVASGTATCGTVSGAAGATSFSATGATLPPGAGNLLTIALPVQFAASLVADPLINTVTATDTGSGASGSASDSDNRAANAGLVVTKTDGVATYTPGGTTTYTIVVGNSGPSDAASVAVADTLPAGLTLTSAVTCVPAGTASCGTVTGAAGQASFSASGASLAAGGGNTLTFSVPVAIGAGVNANPLVNTVTVTSPDALAPATASDSNTLAGSADLAITKTDGVTSVSPGGAIAYTIVASNAGPSNAPGASVSDTMPASLSGVTWTCVGAGGGTCTAAGSGSIADTVNLPVGGSVTYTVNATVSLAASGTLTNTATVVAPAGVTDPNPGNNTVIDVDTVVPLPPPSADLAITKSDGVASVMPGATVAYTIVASNLGPSAVTGATVSDTVPASLTGATWTCVASAGSSCPASGSGSIAAGINLLAAGTATFTLTGTLSASASGTLTNTATIAAPAGVVDPNPGNNSATDSDPITVAPPPVDLSIVITNVGPFSRGQTGAQYTVTVANVGGVPTSGPVTVTIALPAGVTPTAIAGAGWTCTQPVGPCTITTTLGPGGSYPVITITVNVAANAPSTLVATATVAGGGDANGANNTSQNAVSLAPAGQVVEVSVNSPLALLLTLMLVAMAGATRLARRRAR